MADPGAPPTSRRLRLSTILTRLREDAQTETGSNKPPEPEKAAVASPDTWVAPEAASPGRARRKFRLKPRHEPGIRTNITIGEIVDRTTEAGFGFLTAFLALVAVPFVGLSTPFGLAIAFVAAQMMAGLHKPWLPARLRRHAVSLATLDWLGTKLARSTRWMERWVQPRIIVLTRGPFWVLCGFAVLLQGLGLALPLPIPGSNWPFIAIVVLYAIGLLESDGLLILICHILSAAEVVLAVVFWEKVMEAIHKIAAWFH